MSSLPSPTGGIRKAVVSYLTPIAHGSAPFITTFMLIHLTAPVMANVGGSSLSSQVMLLGREYYQTSFGEKYLVLAPLVIHPAAAVTKRLLSPRPLVEPRPVSSMLSMCGYLSLLVFVPIHYMTHRVYPSLPVAPIHSIGPAELDYEFVKTGLQSWPWRSWGLYAGLVGCIAVHSVEGMNVIWTTQFGRGLAVLRKGWKRRVLALVGALPVLCGLWVVSREPVWALASTVRRFGAAYSESLVYRV